MKRPLVVIAAVLSLASIGLAQDRPGFDQLPPILKKALKAHRTSRYSGERIVQLKHGSERVSHTEYVLKDGEKSRIEFPADSQYAGQIIVENGHQRLHFFPDRNEIEVEPMRERDHSGIRLGPEDSRRRKLTHIVTDGGTVAGSVTQLVTVSDDKGNTLQQMWIEPRFGVVLKRVLFDPTGTRNGYSEFTKINFNPTFAPGDFAIDRKGALVVTPPMQARRFADKLGLTPSLGPSNTGFELENARIIHPDKRDVLVQTYVSDSARFTLFQLKGDVNPDRLGKLARGRLSTYSWKRGTESFALVGSPSQEQLKQIAKTLGDG